MRSKNIYDIAGIGIGPFNLGLAALCQPIENLKTVFIEQKPQFDWHGGMMIPGTTLQVPFLADLVTLTDPSSIFSYLCFLRSQNRLLQFGIHEKSYITRSEYNRYCRWVCSQMDNLIFGRCVKSVEYNIKEDLFTLKTMTTGKKELEIIYARHIVAGIGMKPYIPTRLKESMSDRIIHSSGYLYCKNDILSDKSITIIGSGQSAAEIFYDLLVSIDLASTTLNWFTRSDRFYAMETSKLNYEMTSPDYIDFFYNLDKFTKDQLLGQQFTLYKGINRELLEAIYDKLYELMVEEKRYNINIGAHSELQYITKKAGRQYTLSFLHKSQKKSFEITSDVVILATGYQNTFPYFLQPVKHLLQLDYEGHYQVNRNYSIDKANRIFVQNAELCTHGFNAPDLGLGAYRNAVIINAILKKEYYPVDRATCFQSFGMAS